MQETQLQARLVTPHDDHLRDEIETGRVKVLLAAHQPMPLPMQAVYPSRRFVPLKVRVAVDYLRREFLRDARISGAAEEPSR